jgi:hypothetical protein
MGLSFHCLPNSLSVNSKQPQIELREPDGKLAKMPLAKSAFISGCSRRIYFESAYSAIHLTPNELFRLPAG